MIDNLEILKTNCTCLEQAQADFDRACFDVLFDLIKAADADADPDKEHIIYFPKYSIPFLYNREGKIVLSDVHIIGEHLWFHDKEGEAFFTDSFYPKDVVNLVQFIIDNCE